MTGKTAVDSQHAAAAENVSQRRLFFQHPGEHGLQELPTREKVHLQGE
jgi:hypothetical protein